jgi:pimeloyl-ACP methyl ester carboxylesterase
VESKTLYAKSGDVHIAYRVFGDGPRDIILIPGTVSHVELYWELPANQYMLKRLSSFARVIVFDKRGQGLSDRVGEQTLEERSGDVIAVLDAVGSDRAAIYGWSEGGAMSLMTAASYPERISALVLVGSYASMQAEPWSLPREQFDALLQGAETGWGKGILVPLNAPSRAGDKDFVKWWAQLERAAASPGAILALLRANYDIDVRHILPSITVPTLIFHREHDSQVPVRAGRYLAEHIPGARWIELPGEDHLIQTLDQEVLDKLLDEVEEFITGTRQRPEPDRVLATLLMNDIVSSTERAVEVGDSRWNELLTQYYATVRKELAAFQGREVNTTGDGVLATFDGPARAIRCAMQLRDELRLGGLEVRSGLHTGEVAKRGDAVAGIAVHIGARVSALAAPGEVLVTRTVRDLVAGSGIAFEERGEHELKGVPDRWAVYAAVG